MLELLVPQAQKVIMELPDQQDLLDHQDLQETRVQAETKE